MSRQAELEKILQAWYELETCPPPEKIKCRDALNELLDKTRAKTHLSRQDLIEALAERYRAFRTAKEREIRNALSRLR